MYIAGTYEGQLSKDGGHLFLSNYALAYSGWWYSEARGMGPSIVPVSYERDLEDFSLKSAWRVSGEPYGSPGREDLPEPLAALFFVIPLLLLKRTVNV